MSTPRFGRDGIAGRMLGYAVFLLRVAVRLAFRRQDRVVFLTSPPLLPVAGYVLRRLGLGPRYAIWSMDLHPEAELALGLLLPNSLTTRALRSLDRTAFGRADFVVALGSPMRERILAKGVAANRLYTVSVWADPEQLVPVPRDRNPVVRALGLEGKFVVCYSGNAGLMHDFSVILATVERLATAPDIHFLFIGGGPRRGKIESFVRERGLGNLTYTDYFSRKDLKFSLSLGDVHLACLHPDAAGISVPAKVYGAMAVERPIAFVGPASSEPAETIVTAECGAVIDPTKYSDPSAALAQLLLAWRADPAERRRLGENGRSALLQQFERRHACARIESIIHRHWIWPPRDS